MNASFGIRVERTGVMKMLTGGGSQVKGKSESEPLAFR
jgi:hypothetical protein